MFIRELKVSEKKKDISVCEKTDFFTIKTIQKQLQAAEKKKIFVILNFEKMLVSYGYEDKEKKMLFRIIWQLGKGLSYFRKT